MNTKTRIALLSILIVAAFLRFYHLETLPPGLYPDEAMNGTNALTALDGGFSAKGGPSYGWKVFYPDNNGREALFINIQALTLKAVGMNEPWVLRLPSAFFGTLTVLGIYFLGALLFGTRAGLLAAFFAATGVWHIIFSRIGFRAIMAPLLLTWGLYFLVLALKRKREASMQKQVASKGKSWLLASGYWLLPTLGGLAYGLGFHTYIAYRATPLLLIPIFLYFRRDPRAWKVMGIFLLFTFFAGLPIGLYYLAHPADFMGRTTQVSVFSAPSPIHDLGINVLKTIGMFFFVGDGNWRHNPSGEPQLFWPVGILFALGIFFGIKTIVQGFKNKTLDPRPYTLDPFAYGLMFFWLFLATLPVVVSNEGIPHALRAILMIPALFILAGAAGDRLWNYISPKLPRTASSLIVILFFAGLTTQAYYMYFVYWGQSQHTKDAFAANYVALAEKINNAPLSVPKYIIVETGGAMVKVTDPDGSVRDISMAAQTVMFLTDSFLPEKQTRKNLFYRLPDEEDSIPEGAMRFHIR